MSIIHDALKKVQKSMQKNTQAVAPDVHEASIVSPNPAEPVSSSQRKPYPISITFLIAGTISVALVGIALVWHFNLLKLKTEPQPLAKIVISAAPTPAPIPFVQTAATPPAEIPVDVPPPAAPAPKEEPTVLNVQGIMANQNSNVVLINNEIYEEGAVVNGYKILKISLNAIAVEHDGKKETITIKRQP
jgi:hypothetical protein